MKDLTGKKFNNLTVIERIITNKKYEYIWKCKCDCGNIKNISSRNFKNGHTKSCGCLRLKGNNMKHGINKNFPKLVQVYDNMVKRCYSKNNNRYYAYGERGIKICDNWLSSRESFYNWALLNGYSESLQLDRKDNNGNYCPENCRFISQTENIRNSRLTKLTKKKVDDIRKLIQLGNSLTYIAKIYNVSVTNICDIKHYKIWKDDI